MALPRTSCDGVIDKLESDETDVQLGAELSVGHQSIHAKRNRFRRSFRGVLDRVAGESFLALFW